MEDHLATTTEENSSETALRALEEKQSRVRQIFDSQKDRLETVDAIISEELERVAAVLETEHSELSQQREVVDARQREVDQRHVTLEEKRAQLETQRTWIETERATLESLQQSMLAEQQKIERQRGQLSQLHDELIEHRAQWEQNQAEVGTRQNELLDEVQQQLAILKQRTEDLQCRAENKQRELDEQARALQDREEQALVERTRYEEKVRQLDERESQLADRQRSQEEWNEALSERETALVELVSDTKRLRNTTAQHLRSERNLLRSERETVAQALAEIQAKESTLAAMQEQLGLDKEAAWRECEQLRREIDEVRQQLVRSHEEARNTSSESEAAQRKLLEEIERLRAALDARQAVADQLAELKIELERLRGLAAEGEKTAQELASLKAEQTELRSKAAAAEETMRQSSSESEQQSYELKIELERLRGLAAEGEKTAQELASLKAEQTELRSKAAAAEETMRQSSSESEQQAYELKIELEQMREDLAGKASQIQEFGELKSNFAALQSERDALLEKLAAVESGEEASSCSEQQVTELRQEVENLLLLVAEGEKAAQEAKQLKAERDLLAAELQSSKNSAVEGSAVSQDDFQDLQRRLEMAMDDVRDLKRQNTRLKEDLSTNVASPPDSNAGLDWESQKRRMLERLDDEFDDHDQEQVKARLSIEEALQNTDQLIAAKDAQLAELERVLEEQSGNIGDVAVGAHAIAQMLDQDELIVQERENLKAVKDELNEKLRKAEVEISLERAKLARERSELDEQIHQLKLKGNLPAEPTEDAGNKTAAKKTAGARGRWLSRLGLADQDKD